MANFKALIKYTAVWLLVFLFVAQPILAATEVSVDPRSKTAVTTAPNGKTVVNIAAPNGAGVSHNLYNNLQVGLDGLILNNSHKIVSTQLAGYIAGNPNLRNGSASVIINEITGRLPTQLNGFTEIAGQRAHLVIANPNGIVGNGFGFINTSRATLTTGIPMFGGSGSLDGFRVTGGEISIQGNGLNASNTDEVDLISRVASVNAGIWTNRLNIVTGANEVHSDTLAAKPIAGDGNIPGVALDVGQLGGMYANKIYMVGTEKGVGVNHQGVISATGDVQVNQEGKIILTGSTSAKGNVSIQANDTVLNTGTTYAQGTTSLNTTNVLTNTGTIASAKDTVVNAQSISSSGVIGSGINNDGSLAAAGNLTISAANTIKNSGKNLAAGNLTITASDLDNRSGTIYAKANAVIAANGSINNTGAKITATVGIDNTNGQIAANGQLKINTGTDLNNSSGVIQGDNGLVVGAATINNTKGNLLNIGKTSVLALAASQFLNNQSGSISSNGSMSITAGGIQNLDNHMTAQGDFSLTVNGDFTNQGTLGSNGTLSIKAANVTNATSGIINADTTNVIAAAALQNDGKIEGNKVTVTSQDMTNTNAVIGSIVTINANNLTNQGSAAIIGATDTVNLFVKNALTNTNGANILSLGNINIAADSKTDAKGNFVNRTQQVNNISSSIQANSNMNLSAENVANTTNCDPAIGTSTSTSTVVLTLAPHVKYEELSSHTNNDGTRWELITRTFGGPRQYNDKNGYYVKLTMTVPADHIISYDATKKLVVFRDIDQTDLWLIDGPGLHGYYSEDQFERYLNTATYRVQTGNSSYDTRYYTRDQFSTLPVFSGTSNRGESVTIAGPTWDGKQPGQTNAYCQSIVVNADGSYSITFYPGYNPNVNLSPENQRTMETYHSDASAEETRTTTTTTATQYIMSTPTPGKITVGNNLNLNIGHQFTNKYSQVAIGNNITGNIGSLNNQGYNLTRTITSTEQSYFHDYFETGGGWSGPRIESSDGYQTYGPYISTNYIGIGIPATFTAKYISVTGDNVSNIQQAPSGISTNPIGATLYSPTQTAAATSSLGTAAVSSLLTMPQNALYTTHKEPNAKYLVETDPRFANYQNFISSDYMLNLLNLDPSITGKRLGDAFYEQQLVNQQINQLTGKQYISGYDNTNTEFKQLMENGVSTGKTLNLVAGVALTEAQIASLTSDIVWMVQEEVTLADGSKQKALVPVVYLCPASKMNLTAGGALIAADKVDIKVTGNVTNSGSIVGSSSNTINANNIINKDGGVIATSNGTTNLQAVTDILNQSGTISGNSVMVTAGRDIINETTTRQIKASTNTDNHAWTGSNTVVGSTGTIKANDITLQAGRDVTINGGVVTGGTKDGNNINITAGRNLNVGVVTATNIGTDSAYNSSNASTSGYSHTEINNVGSVISGANINLNSKGDTTLTSAYINADNNLSVTGAGNISITAAKDSHSETIKSDGAKGTYLHTGYDETVVGTSLNAGKNITISNSQPASNQPLNSGKISIEGSTVNSTSGKISVTSDQDIVIKEVMEKHESLTEDHGKGGGWFSGKKTDQRDYSLTNQAVGSTLSGDQVSINSGKNITVSGSNVVGTNDVSLTAANNINIQSAQNSSHEEHYYQESESGAFGSGGIGFTIGTKSIKTTTTIDTVSQVGSAIGSEKGNININAGKDVRIAASNITSIEKDINISGQNVTIQTADNVNKEKDTYEYKQTGLTVAVGGGVIDKVNSVYQPAKRATEVQDSRLKALYDYKAAKTANNLLKGNDADGDKDTKGNKPAVSVSFGTSKQSSQTDITTVTAQSSNLSAGGNINITASGTGAKDSQGKAIDGDINIQGSNVNGANVTVDAAHNINLISAKNTSDTNTSSSSSSVGIGGTIGKANSISITGSIGKSNGNESITTYTQTQITASGALHIKSGNDTGLIGAKASGDTVKIDVGGNLNLQSQQDTDNFHESSTSASINAGIGSGITGSASKGKIDSDYRSVTSQTGIYSGKGGFDIKVQGNTDLKGAVIASTATPDKNKLSTGTLTYSDIQNHAEYDSSSVGVNYDSKKYKKDDPNYKNQGLTPNIGVTANGKADSTTKSAIAKGTIDIRSNPKQEISNLSRDTTNSVNALGKIFDKAKVQEQQELAKVFGEEAFKAVGNLGLKENDPKKVALKAVVGGIMSQVAGGGFVSGATSAGFTQIIQNQLANIKDPATLQWVSGIIGAAASKLVGGNAQTGSSIAVSDIRNNFLSHQLASQLQIALAKAKSEGKSLSEILTIIDVYMKASYSYSPENSSREFQNEDEVKTFLLNNYGYNWDQARENLKASGQYTSEYSIWENFKCHVENQYGVIISAGSLNSDVISTSQGPNETHAGGVTIRINADGSSNVRPEGSDPKVAETSEVLSKTNPDDVFTDDSGRKWAHIRDASGNIVDDKYLPDQSQGKDYSRIPGNYSFKNGTLYQADSSGNLISLGSDLSSLVGSGQRVRAVDGNGNMVWWDVVPDQDGKPTLSWAGPTGKKSDDGTIKYQIGTDGRDHAYGYVDPPGSGIVNGTLGVVDGAITAGKQVLSDLVNAGVAVSKLSNPYDAAKLGLETAKFVSSDDFQKVIGELKKQGITGITVNVAGTLRSITIDDWEVRHQAMVDAEARGDSYTANKIAVELGVDIGVTISAVGGAVKLISKVPSAIENIVAKEDVVVNQTANAVNSATTIWRGTTVVNGETIVKNVGAFGEHVAEDVLAKNGWKDFAYIKNGSDNGIDIIARGPNGQLGFFEVKTSSTGSIPNLSSRQTNMNEFVNDVLSKAAKGEYPYQNVDSSTRSSAQKILEEFRNNPGNISGNVIGVDLKNGITRISRWER